MVMREELKRAFEMVTTKARKPEPNKIGDSDRKKLAEKVGDQKVCKALYKAVTEHWPGSLTDLYRASGVSQTSFYKYLGSGVPERGIKKFRLLAESLGFKWKPFLESGELKRLDSSDFAANPDHQRLARILRSPKAKTIREVLKMAESSLPNENG